MAPHFTLLTLRGQNSSTSPGEHLDDTLDKAVFPLSAFSRRLGSPEAAQGTEHVDVTWAVVLVAPSFCSLGGFDERLSQNVYQGERDSGTAQGLLMYTKP